MTTFEQLQKENRVLKQRNDKLETQLKDASLHVGKNAHDIEDLQKELEAEKTTLTQRVKDLQEELAEANKEKERHQKQKLEVLSQLQAAEKARDAAVETCKSQEQGLLDAQNAINDAEGHHARCEEEKRHLDAKYQALVKEHAAIEAQPVTDTESLLRQTVEDLTRESRIQHYALEYLMTLYDSECDRIRDLLDIQQELKAALKEAEDAIQTLEAVNDEPA